jgi:hypothetical protein
MEIQMKPEKIHEENVALRFAHRNFNKKFI